MERIVVDESCTIEVVEEKIKTELEDEANVTFPIEEVFIKPEISVRTEPTCDAETQESSSSDVVQLGTTEIEEADELLKNTEGSAISSCSTSREVVTVNKSIDNQKNVKISDSTNSVIKTEPACPTICNFVEGEIIVIEDDCDNVGEENNNVGNPEPCNLPEWTIPMYSTTSRCYKWVTIDFESSRQLRHPHCPNNESCEIKVYGPEGNVTIKIPADPPDFQPGTSKKKFRFIMKGYLGRYTIPMRENEENVQKVTPPVVEKFTTNRSGEIQVAPHLKQSQLGEKSPNVFVTNQNSHKLLNNSKSSIREENIVKNRPSNVQKSVQRNSVQLEEMAPLSTKNDSSVSASNQSLPKSLHKSKSLTHEANAKSKTSASSSVENLNLLVNKTQNFSNLVHGSVQRCSNSKNASEKERPYVPVANHTLQKSLNGSKASITSSVQVDGKEEKTQKREDNVKIKSSNKDQPQVQRKSQIAPFQNGSSNAVQRCSISTFEPEKSTFKEVQMETMAPPSAGKGNFMNLVQRSVQRGSIAKNEPENPLFKVIELEAVTSPAGKKRLNVPAANQKPQKSLNKSKFSTAPVQRCSIPANKFEKMAPPSTEKGATVPATNQSSQKSLNKFELSKRDENTILNEDKVVNNKNFPNLVQRSAQRCLIPRSESENPPSKAIDSETKRLNVSTANVNSQKSLNMSKSFSGSYGQVQEEKLQEREDRVQVQKTSNAVQRSSILPCKVIQLGKMAPPSTKKASNVPATNHSLQKSLNKLKSSIREENMNFKTSSIEDQSLFRNNVQNNFSNLVERSVQRCSIAKNEPENQSSKTIKSEKVKTSSEKERLYVPSANQTLQKSLSRSKVSITSSVQVDCKGEKMQKREDNVKIRSSSEDQLQVQRKSQIAPFQNGFSKVVQRSSIPTFEHEKFSLEAVQPPSAEKGNFSYLVQRSSIVKNESEKPPSKAIELEEQKRLNVPTANLKPQKSLCQNNCSNTVQRCSIPTNKLEKMAPPSMEKGTSVPATNQSSQKSLNKPESSKRDENTIIKTTFLNEDEVVNQKMVQRSAQRCPLPKNEPENSPSKAIESEKKRLNVPAANQNPQKSLNKSKSSTAPCQNNCSNTVQRCSIPPSTEKGATVPATNQNSQKSLNKSGSSKRGENTASSIEDNVLVQKIIQDAPYPNLVQKAIQRCSVLKNEPESRSEKKRLNVPSGNLNSQKTEQKLLIRSKSTVGKENNEDKNLVPKNNFSKQVQKSVQRCSISKNEPENLSSKAAPSTEKKRLNVPTANQESQKSLSRSKSSFKAIILEKVAPPLEKRLNVAAANQKTEKSLNRSKSSNEVFAQVDKTVEPEWKKVLDTLHIVPNNSTGDGSNASARSSVVNLPNVPPSQSTSIHRNPPTKTLKAVATPIDLSSGKDNGSSTPRNGCQQNDAKSVRILNYIVIQKDNPFFANMNFHQEQKLNNSKKRPHGVTAKEERQSSVEKFENKKNQKAIKPQSYVSKPPPCRLSVDSGIGSPHETFCLEDKHENMGKCAKDKPTETRLSRKDAGRANKRNIQENVDNGKQKASMESGLREEQRYTKISTLEKMVDGGNDLPENSLTRKESSKIQRSFKTSVVEFEQKNLISIDERVTKPFLGVDPKMSSNITANCAAVPKERSSIQQKPRQYTNSRKNTKVASEVEQIKGVVKPISVSKPKDTKLDRIAKLGEKIVHKDKQKLSTTETKVLKEDNETDPVHVLNVSSSLSISVVDWSNLSLVPMKPRFSTEPDVTITPVNETKDLGCPQAKRRKIAETIPNSPNNKTAPRAERRGQKRKNDHSKLENSAKKLHLIKINPQPSPLPAATSTSLNLRDPRLNRIRQYRSHSTQAKDDNFSMIATTSQITKHPDEVYSRQKSSVTKLSEYPSEMKTDKWVRKHFSRDSKVKSTKATSPINSFSKGPTAQTKPEDLGKILQEQAANLFGSATMPSYSSLLVAYQQLLTSAVIQQQDNNTK